MERGWHFATILSSLSNSITVLAATAQRHTFRFGTESSASFRCRRAAPKRESREAVFDGLENSDRRRNPIYRCSRQDRGSATSLLGCNGCRRTKRTARLFRLGASVSIGTFSPAIYGSFPTSSHPSRWRMSWNQRSIQNLISPEITTKWLHKNSPVNRFVDGVQILSNQAGGARMGYTIFGTNGVALTLTALRVAITNGTRLESDTADSPM